MLLGLVVLGFLPGPANAEIARPVRLGWDASTDPKVRGYALYYGAVGQTPGTRLDAGTNLFGTISNLTAGADYWIYAVSYDAANIESVPSNQLVFTAPAPPPPKLEIARQADGSMKLSYKAAPAQVCGFQFTSKLNPPVWQTLTNVTADSLGNVVALDLAAKAVPQRFYRVALAPQPLVSALTATRLSNGHLRLNWTAPPYSTNRVIFAAHPQATLWPTFTNVVADAEGRAAVTDAAPTSVSQRFYRVMLP